MLHSIIEIHDSDGSFLKVEDESSSGLEEPCAITFPKIKEEIKWDPEDLKTLGSLYPGFSDGWIERAQSPLNDQSTLHFHNVDRSVIDLTKEELICKTIVEFKDEPESNANPQCPRTGTQNDAATACSRPSKICESVPCLEEKNSHIIKNSSSLRKVVQGSYCHPSGKDKSVDNLKNNSCKKCSRSVDVDRPVNRKRVVAQRLAIPEKKSCSCAREVETCALHPDRKKHFCSLCGAMFLWKEYLNLHMASHAEEMPYSCSKCFTKFRFKESLEKHMRFHPGSKSSPCSAELKSKSSSDAPVTLNALNAPFGCAVCNLRFLWQEQLRNHVVAHPDRKLFFCTICKLQIPLEDELFLHVAQHSEKHKYKCTVCNVILDSQIHLDNHMSSHSAEKHFPCALCSTSFTSIKLLDWHVMLSHAGSEQHSHSSSKQVQPANKHVILEPKCLRSCQQEGNAGAKPKQCLPKYMVPPQKEPNLRLHMVQGIKVFKDFFVSPSKNGENSDVSIICEKVRSPSESRIEVRESDKVNQCTEVQRLGGKLSCHLCNAKFREKRILQNHIEISHSANCIQRKRVT